MEQPPGADLRTGESTQDDNRRFAPRTPGLCPPGSELRRLARSTAAAQNGDATSRTRAPRSPVKMSRLSPEERVLDACAAPGGKSAYLAEMMANQGPPCRADQDDLRLRVCATISSDWV